jgi:lipopolysaccharide transport system permease protein
VLYSRDFLPEAYRGWLSVNPFTFYPEYLRSILLGFGEISVTTQATAFGVAVATCAIGYAVFRRLNPRFEDFL